MIASMVLSEWTLWTGWLLYGPLVLLALFKAPWVELFSDSRRQHLLFGTVLGLCVLWLLRRDFPSGVAVHFIGMTAVTLLLHWPLAIKGIGVAVLGAVLLLGLLALRKAAHTPAAQPVPDARTGKVQMVLIALGAVLAFALVNWDVRGKEQVIAHGQRILVPLVPVDPRSLMQGDYMDLRFALPAEVQEGLEKISAPVAYVKATVDAQGVATVKALADAAKTPSAGEVILPLKQLKGRWVLVTDAYFFPEGQGDHFTQGRFGDLRVLPDGRALLVGLADGQGQEIKPLPGGSIWDARPAAERLDERRRMDIEGRKQLGLDETTQPAADAAAELSQEEARKAAGEAVRAPEVAPPVNAP